MDPIFHQAHTDPISGASLWWELPTYDDSGEFLYIGWYRQSDGREIELWYNRMTDERRYIQRIQQEEFSLV